MLNNPLSVSSQLLQDLLAMPSSLGWVRMHPTLSTELRLSERSRLCVFYRHPTFVLSQLPARARFTAIPPRIHWSASRDYHHLLVPLREHCHVCRSCRPAAVLGRLLESCLSGPRLELQLRFQRSYQHLFRMVGVRTDLSGSHLPGPGNAGRVCYLVSALLRHE